MSRYDELRPLYQRPLQERAALVRREMLRTLAEARDALAELAAADPDRLQLVFGMRCEELIEIAVEAAAGLERMLLKIPVDGPETFDDEGMRTLRHDLRGPVGTLRGAVMMLGRRTEDSDHPLAERARAIAVAAEDLRDTIDALTEDEERE